MPEKIVYDPTKDGTHKQKPAKSTEKTANSPKVEKPEKVGPNTKDKQKRNGQPKISKYGFIHLGKDIYETLSLPKKTDIPIGLKIDAEARTMLVTIK